MRRVRGWESGWAMQEREEEREMGRETARRDTCTNSNHTVRERMNINKPNKAPFLHPALAPSLRDCVASIT